MSATISKSLVISEPRQDARRLQFGNLVWLSPSLTLMGVFFLLPVGYAIYLGFTNLQLVGPHAVAYSFTGLANLRRMIHDSGFWNSTKLTVVFVVGSGILAQSLLGMLLALLMRRALPLIRMGVGAIVVLAWVLPEVSAAFIWYAFSQTGGTLGHVLGQPNTNYLTSVPLLIVSVANVWRNTAFAMLIFSAGLRNVPLEVEQAAELEGAAPLRRLISVTLPIIRPTIVITLLLLTLGNLSDFTLIYVMTQGGPGTSTTTLPIYMYIQAFQFDALGYATAVALALVLLGALLSLLYVREFAEKRLI